MGQKMPKIDETVLTVEIHIFRWFGFYQFCHWGISQMYESIFSLRWFSFIKVLHISGRSFRKKNNSSLSEWPKNFSYLFILLIRNRVHLNYNAVSRKLKRKKKSTHKNGCFDMKYLKLMAKRFKRAFYLYSNCYSL